MSCFLQVLMEKVKACESANSPPMYPSTNKPIAVRHNDGASSNNYQVSPQAASSGAAGKNQEFVVQGEGTHPSNRMHSDDLPQPLMTREDMAKLFKNPKQQQQQPAHHKPPVDISEQQRIEEERQRQTEEEVSKSEQETDKALQELDRSRALRPPPSSSAPGSPKPSCIKSQASLDDELEESGENLEANLEDDRPYDPNLVCPKCGKQFRVGEIQKVKRHILKCTNN